MARMKGNAFLSRRFSLSASEPHSLRDVELYLTRQSRELYVKLAYLEKRISLLEARSEGDETNGGAE